MIRTSLVALLLAVVALVGCSDSHGDAICSRFKTLCSGSGNSGITVTCSPDDADDLSNGEDVENCLNAATDCSGATACMLTGKK